MTLHLFPDDVVDGDGDAASAQQGGDQNGCTFSSLPDPLSLTKGLIAAAPIGPGAATAAFAQKGNRARSSGRGEPRHVE